MGFSPVRRNANPSKQVNNQQRRRGVFRRTRCTSRSRPPGDPQLVKGGGDHSPGPTGNGFKPEIGKGTRLWKTKWSQSFRTVLVLSGFGRMDGSTAKPGGALRVWVKSAGVSGPKKSPSQERLIGTLEGGKIEIGKAPHGRFLKEGGESTPPIRTTIINLPGQSSEDVPKFIEIQPTTTPCPRWEKVRREGKDRHGFHLAKNSKTGNLI